MQEHRTHSDWPTPDTGYHDQVVSGIFKVGVVEVAGEKYARVMHNAHPEPVMIEEKSLDPKDIQPTSVHDKKSPSLPAPLSRDSLAADNEAAIDAHFNRSTSGTPMVADSPSPSDTAAKKLAPMRPKIGVNPDDNFTPLKLEPKTTRLGKITSKLGAFTAGAASAVGIKRNQPSEASAETDLAATSGASEKEKRTSHLRTRLTRVALGALLLAAAGKEVNNHLDIFDDTTSDSVATIAAPQVDHGEGESGLPEAGSPTATLEVTPTSSVTFTMPVSGEATATYTIPTATITPTSTPTSEITPTATQTPTATPTHTPTPTMEQSMSTPAIVPAGTATPSETIVKTPEITPTATVDESTIPPEKTPNSSPPIEKGTPATEAAQDDSTPETIAEGGSNAIRIGETPEPTSEQIIEPGSLIVCENDGFKDLIRQTRPDLNDEQAYQVYLYLVSTFGPQNMIESQSVGVYQLPNGDWGLDSTGSVIWAEGVEAAILAQQPNNP